MQTGASSILFRAEQRLTPPYRIEVEFEGTDPMRRNEGYGIVFGGSELDGAQQSYGYVLVRQDACLFCLGAYTGAVTDEDFRLITVDYAVRFAEALRAANPDAAFCLLSGAGADPRPQTSN